MSQIINGRFFTNTPLNGSVQGWAHPAGEPGVALSWSRHGGDGISYSAGSLYLSPEDARAIAAALIEAADYSEKPTEAEKVELEPEAA